MTVAGGPAAPPPPLKTLAWDLAMLMRLVALDRARLGDGRATRQISPAAALEALAETFPHRETALAALAALERAATGDPR